MPYDICPPKDLQQSTAEALTRNGFDTVMVETGAEAKQFALSIIPVGVEVMTMTSVTLETIGLDKELNESGRYMSVRSKFQAVDDREKKRLGAAPEWSVGSVHAVTQDGHVLIASASGSQIPGYIFGADHVVWVVGAQKITKNVDEGTKRIYEYVLPLEDARAKKVYGVGSAVNDLLIMNANAFSKGRVTIILVNELLGF